MIKAGLFVIHEIVYPALLTYLDHLLDKMELLQKTGDDIKANKVEKKADKISDLIGKVYMLALRLHVKK